MAREDLINQLYEFVDAGAGEEDLLELTASTDSPHLYEDAVEAFGSWDAFLAHAVVALRKVVTAPERRRAAAAPASRSSSPEDEERPPRMVGPDAKLPVLIITREGALTALDLTALPPTRQPEVFPFPAGPGQGHVPDRLRLGNPSTAQVLMTSGGHTVSLDFRLIPWFEPDSLIRPLFYRWGTMSRDEVVVDVFAHSDVRDHARYYTVSAYGQIKASDSTELSRISSEPVTGFLLKDDDALFCGFAGGTSTDVFVASSHGKAIVFDTGEIRSQGRKATGVKAIGLDPDARVVGAFPVDRDLHVALVTEQGLMKRTPLEEFRPQGRGGAGLQTCKLNSGDLVATMAPVDPAGDVILLTDEGRFARFPAFDIPSMGRAAKGDPVVELGDGETIIQVLGVPAGEFEG